MKKVLNSFKGMIPKENQNILSNGYAYYALDLVLDRGFITPMRTNKLIGTGAAGIYDKVLIEHYGRLFTFEEGVSSTSWLIDCPRIYITGRRTYLEMAHVIGNMPLSFYRVGLPTPENTVKLIGQADYLNKDENNYYSSWIYTFVNDLAEESAPSPSSNLFLHTDGQDVSLEIKYNFDTSYSNIVGVNLYRASTGFTTGGEKEQTQETEFLYVKTYPISLNNTLNVTIQIVDNLKMLDLGWVLPTREAQEPPLGLRGVTLLTDSTVLCGYKDNKIYFSEPDEPANWREEQELTLEDNIINIKEMGGVLYVMTDGRPYYIDVSKGCNGRECRAIIKEQQYIPTIACDGQNSPTVSEYGVLYVSKEGLIALNKGSPPQILTEDYYSEEQWRQLEPQKMKIRVHQGTIYIITQYSNRIADSTFMYNPKNKNGVIASSDILTDAVVTRTGELIGLEKALKRILHIYGGEGYRSYVWMSELMHDKKDRVNVYRLDKENRGVTLSIRDEESNEFMDLNEALLASNYNQNSVIGRIKRYTAKSGIRILLKGTARINRMILASRREDLTDKKE